MAYPSFAAAGVTTVTFSQGFLAPEDQQESPRQIIKEAEDATIYAYTLSTATLRFLLGFQDMPAGDMTALLAFLRDPLINYAEGSFTYTDSDSTAWEVSYLPDSLSRFRNASGTFDGSLALRGRL